MFVTINIPPAKEDNFMCNNGYSIEQRKYFDDLAHIGVRVIEGANLIDAAAERNMTADEFQKALKTDVRKVNFPVYLKFSKALLSPQAFFPLLKEELCLNTDDDDYQYRFKSCVDFGVEACGEKDFKEFVENEIRFCNYQIYSMIAKYQGYKKLAP